MRCYDGKMQVQPHCCPTSSSIISSVVSSSPASSFISSSSVPTVDCDACGDGIGPPNFQFTVPSVGTFCHGVLDGLTFIVPYRGSCVWTAAYLIGANPTCIVDPTSICILITVYPPNPPAQPMMQYQIDIGFFEVGGLCPAFTDGDPCPVPGCLTVGFNRWLSECQTNSCFDTQTIDYWGAPAGWPSPYFGKPLVVSPA